MMADKLDQALDHQRQLNAQQAFPDRSLGRSDYSNLLNPQPLTADTLKQAILEGVAGATRPRLSLEELEQEIAKVKVLQKEREAALPRLRELLGQTWKVRMHEHPVEVIGWTAGGQAVVNCKACPSWLAHVAPYLFQAAHLGRRISEVDAPKEPPPPPPSHEWTIERGNLVFCGRCGEETSERESDACEPMPEQTVKERIESTIAVVMYNRGYSGRWHNQPMAIEARAKHAATRRVAYWKVSRTREQDLIGGWNKRAP